MRQISAATVLALALAGAAASAPAQVGDASWNAEGIPSTAPDSAQSTAPLDPEVAPAAKAPASPVPAPVEPIATGSPHTELNPGGSEHDPLLDPKPLPPAKLALIGGIVRKLDTVRNRLTVLPFGGGPPAVIYFDERTRILSGGRETTMLAIHRGDRVHVDTQDLGGQIFASTIQVRSGATNVQASGQVVDVEGGQIRMRDRLSGELVRFAVDERTRIESHGSRITTAQLRPGALIEVAFTPGRGGGIAQSIIVNATPGESYVFAGILTDINIAEGVLALDNRNDGNNYELSFDPAAERNLSRLVVGADVFITARFDGRTYQATSIRLAQPQRSAR
jgi:hypothetical protein